MAKALIAFAPLAKQSDMACTAAIRPKRKRSEVHALKKSTV